MCNYQFTIYSAKQLKLPAIIVNLLFAGILIAADTTLVKVITLPYNVHSIASDSVGTIWMAGARGLQYYDWENERFVTTDPSLKSHIIADRGKVVQFDHKDGVLFPWGDSKCWLPHMPPGQKRLTSGRDKFGEVWVSSGSQLFIYSIEDRFERILPEYSTRGICREGEDLYVQTYSGVFRNDQQILKSPLRMGEGEIKKAGEYLFFAQRRIIRYHAASQTWKVIMLEQEPELVESLNKRQAIALELIKDTIWVGTSFGLGYIDNDSVLMVSQAPNIQDIVRFQDGLLIAGIDLNVRKDRLTHPIPESCRGIYLWKNNELQTLDLPELNYYQIVKANDRYYMASDSGVVVWNGKNVTSIITEDVGLTDNRTCSMAIDEDGFLWVSTLSGLNRINLSTGKITRYLENIEFNCQSVMQNDSLVYMGSVQGVYFFNPKEFIGDDLDSAPVWTIQQILSLLGGGILILSLVLFYSFRQFHRRKLQLKEAQLKATEKKLFLLQIEQILFREDFPLSVSGLAYALNISERSLYRKFKEYDLTPGTYIKELKLKKARILLDRNYSHGQLKEVAQKVGYTESYLRKILKEEKY